jgi:hypothetical protein
MIGEKMSSGIRENNIYIPLIGIERNYDYGVQNLL